jgi:hypothetical protein
LLLATAEALNALGSALPFGAYLFTAG